MSLPKIRILAGKRPKRETVLFEAAERLTNKGFSVHLRWREPISDIAGWPRGLVVQRGVSIDVLQTLAARGGPVINDPDACLSLGDRSATLSHLASAGLPVPEHRICEDWTDVTTLAGESAVYVKAGGSGRGAGVARIADSDGAPPFPGPWHVETEQPGDGIDRKIYVVGHRVFGLLKRWPRDGEARPFNPTNAMREIALNTGSSLGLEIFGVDLIGKDDRFAIVDVNAFPGFRGVPGAYEAVADYIAARAG